VPLAYSGTSADMTLTPREPKTIALDPYPFDVPELVHQHDLPSAEAK